MTNFTLPRALGWPFALAAALTFLAPAAARGELGRQESRQLDEIEKEYQERLKDENDRNDARANQWLKAIEAAKALEGTDRDEALRNIIAIDNARDRLRDRENPPSEAERAELMETLKSGMNFLEGKDINLGRPGGHGGGDSGTSPGGDKPGGEKPGGNSPSPGAWDSLHGTVPGSVISEGKAESLLDRGDYQGASAEAEKAILMDPTRAKPYLLKSQAEERLGNLAAANEAASKALKLDPSNGQALSMAKLTAGRETPSGGGSPAGAERPAGTDFFRQEPASMPVPRMPDFSAANAASSGRLADRAANLLKQKDYAAAAQAAERAVAADSKDVNARFVQILSLMNMRRLPEALKAADEAIAVSPDQSKLWTARAKVRNLLKDYARAFEDARKASELDPRDPEARIQLAWAADGLGRRNESLAYLREAASLNGRYADLYARALTLKDGELAKMLAGELMEEAAPAARSRSFPNAKRTGLMLGTTLFGGLLLGLAFLRIAKGSREAALPEAAAALGRTEPAASEAASLTGPAGDPTGQYVGGAYRVVRQIGLGGMGVVYEAMDTVLERRVAVKKMREEIRSDPRERERFLKEARMVAALHHPNIVDIYGIVDEGSDAYLVFEYVDGKTLHEVLRERGKLSLPEALGVSEGIAAALDYAHSKEMIHRDLKPSNVMVSRERVVKVMDFGVARQAKDSLTRMSMTNTVVGTPPYMAPEQEQGVVSKGSDVYALAICIYEMLTGELPFAGVGAGMLLAKMNKTFIPPTRRVGGLPPGIDAVFDTAFEPDPKNRWRTSGEFLAKLKELR